MVKDIAPMLKKLATVMGISILISVQEEIFGADVIGAF